MERSSAERRESLEDLLRIPLARVKDVSERDGFYMLGVETESRRALTALGQTTHARYVRRDADGLIRARLQTGIEAGGVSVVTVSGPSKAGKSRTLAEAVAACVPEAWLIAPTDARAFYSLARRRAPSQLDHASGCVIWIDDIEPFVAEHGLNAITLELLRSWRRPVLVAATHGGKGGKVTTDAAFAERTGDLLRRYEPVRLSSELTDHEITQLPELDSPETQQQARAFGEFMIAAPELLGRYRNTTDSPEGVAVTRAAVDWRRVGMVRAAPSEALEATYIHYLNGPADPARFERGLQWATTPLYAHVALLQGRDEYTPYDYVAAQEKRAIPGETFETIVQRFATSEELAIDVGVAALEGDDIGRAEQAFRVGDSRNDAICAYNLGVLLQRRADHHGAHAAFSRADRRGLAAGARMLGVLFAEAGDVGRAEEAYRRAYERGYTAAATDLAGLLIQRGDGEGAEAVCRSADERGDAAAASNLGVLLQQRGDRDGAEAAYRRADERGNAIGAYNLGLLLQSLGDHHGAQAAFQRANQRGHAASADNRGARLRQRGDVRDAHAGWEPASAPRAPEVIREAPEAPRDPRRAGTSSDPSN
jgi:tetratricopeptide (TPR) repeat protein